VASVTWRMPCNFSRSFGAGRIQRRAIYTAHNSGAGPNCRCSGRCILSRPKDDQTRIARLDDEFASPIARGINEGFADYAQATFFDDPRFGDWVRDEPKGGRRCDDKTLRLKANAQDPQDRYKVGARGQLCSGTSASSLGPGSRMRLRSTRCSSSNRGARRRPHAKPCIMSTSPCLPPAGPDATKPRSTRSSMGGWPRAACRSTSSTDRPALAATLGEERLLPCRRSPSRLSRASR
jgi:hypothetical protein